jgi:hypothetical protein
MSLEQIEGYPLGNEDISKMLPNTNIFTYPYLKHVKHIDEVFDDDGRAVMLYLTEDATTGHWVGLLRKPDHIEFFDPYGGKPDSELHWASGGLRQKLGITQPFLTNLLRQSGLPVIYNKVDFQKKDDDVQTCGRHTASRLLFSHLSLPEYYNMIKKSKLTADEFVSGLTFPLIHK